MIGCIGGCLPGEVSEKGATMTDATMEGGVYVLVGGSGTIGADAREADGEARGEADAGGAARG